MKYFYVAMKFTAKRTEVEYPVIMVRWKTGHDT